MQKDDVREPSVTVRIKATEFHIPLVQDGVLLGKDCPIGCEAMHRALMLLQPTEFHRIALDTPDDVVGNILVRSSVLKRVSEKELVEIIMRRFRPMMEPTDCLHLEISTETTCEDEI